MSYTNGEIPRNLLVAVPWDTAELTLPGVLQDLIALNKAFKDRFGHNLIINDAYRDIATQRAYYKNPPSGAGTAARPGTSNHGWAKAFDFKLTKAEYAWMLSNANAFGFHNPLWARDGKGVEEPWHWEHTSATAVTPDVVKPDVIANTPRPIQYQEDDMTSFVTEALQDAYKIELGRGASDAELAPRRVRIARGQTTLAVEIQSIDASVESNRFAVHTLYRELLGRDGRVVDYDNWIASAGNDIAKIRAGIMGSDEYKNRKR